MLFKNLELNKLQTYVPADINIPRETQKAIMGIVLKSYSSAYWENELPPDLEEARQEKLMAILRSLEWKSIGEDGTFVKHLQKRLYKRFKEGVLNKSPLTNKELSDIGKLISQSYTNPEEIYYDVTNDLAWDAGDFSDKDSCFWQSRSDNRYRLEGAGVCAFRLFKESNDGKFYENYKGKSRSWLKIFAPGEYKLEMKVPFAVLFNSYGANLEEQAALISKMFGLNWSTLSASGDIWINDGRACIIYNRDDGGKMPRSLQLSFPRREITTLASGRRSNNLVTTMQELVEFRRMITGITTVTYGAMAF